jgi:hypothetical protein
MYEYESNRVLPDFSFDLSNMILVATIRLSLNPVEALGIALVLPLSDRRLFRSPIAQLFEHFNMFEF